MRTELPSPSWADAHRAQDDAHTLTLPAQRPAGLVDALRAMAEDGETVRSAIAAPPAVALTLTL